jgi:hypothetical protein
MKQLAIKLLKALNPHGVLQLLFELHKRWIVGYDFTNEGASNTATRFNVSAWVSLSSFMKAFENRISTVTVVRGSKQGSVLYPFDAGRNVHYSPLHLKNVGSPPGRYPSKKALINRGEGDNHHAFTIVILLFLHMLKRQKYNF